jgi:hypothetical protein
VNGAARTARIVAFRPRDPMLEFHCRRRADAGRALQSAQERVAEAQRRRDALLDEAAAVAAEVAAMSPAERAQRAAELGLLDGLYRDGFPPFDGPGVA